MLRSDRNEVVLKARALRRSMTLPEGLLWQQLRRRPDGLKFRRQHPIGPYIADFYCASARLIIEVDGAAHSMGDRPEGDASRDRWLAANDLQVMRVAAEDVLRRIDDVVGGILAEARRNLPLHHASHGSPPHDGVAGRN
jgi:very-short-patch-repair endonuclease